MAITPIPTLQSLDPSLRWDDEYVAMRFREVPQFPDTARCGRITGRVAVNRSDVLGTVCS